MKREPNPHEVVHEGETTVFWRPSLPLVAPDRPRRRTYAFSAAIVVAAASSMAGFVGWARAPSATTNGARAPIRLAPLALVASSTADDLAAVLEAVDVTTVRATDATAGQVRRALARGTPVARGSPLVTLSRADPEPARRLAELDALLEQYDESSPAATPSASAPAKAAASAAAGGLASAPAVAIERARAAYERAVADSRDAAMVRAPAAGIVVGTPPRIGEAVAAGAELARVAATVQLVVPARDVEGDGADCRVALYDRGRAVVDGTLIPTVADAGSRTVTLTRFPADVPLGAIGRVKAVCR